jgi:hypothetical protein
MKVLRPFGEQILKSYLVDCDDNPADTHGPHAWTTRMDIVPFIHCRLVQDCNRWAGQSNDGD